MSECGLAICNGYRRPFRRRLKSERAANQKRASSTKPARAPLPHIPRDWKKRTAGSPSLSCTKDIQQRQPAPTQSTQPTVPIRQLSGVSCCFLPAARDHKLLARMLAIHPRDRLLLRRRKKNIGQFLCLSAIYVAKAGRS
jgi:hypothetical protein